MKECGFNMSRKLPFEVIHTSGSDDEHPGKELEVQGPASKGWQSARFCVYPQEIILSLNVLCKVVKLQILSHQYNITSKVEFYIANPGLKGSSSLNGLNFQRLGYVLLSENEATNFQARELKSVHLNAEGQFLKLVIHKNFVNKMNLYNQVSIVAINVIGHPLAKEQDDNSNYFHRTDDVINSYIGRDPSNNSSVKQRHEGGGKYISPLDDLAFDMYTDPETAQLIRKLETKKVQAVSEERFDYANKLKLAMADLYKVGEKLGKYEIEKRRAVEMEDFELAKAKKLASDEYRLFVYKQLNVFDLLELKQNSKYEKVLEQKKTEKFLVEISTPTITPPLTPHKSNPAVAVSPSHTPAQDKLPPVSLSPSLMTQKPVIVNNDERPLPALKGKTAELIEEPVEENTVNENMADTELPTLSEKEEREASVIIDTFGMIVARKLFSKSWKHRQESISSFSTELSSPSKVSSENSPSRVSRAVVAALRKGMNDQVFVVLQDSVELLKKLLTEYIPENNLSKTELTRTIEKLFPLILKRTGDVAPRSRNMMFETAVDIARSQEVKSLGIVPKVVCEPIKSKKQAPWRAMKSQVEMIKLLIPELGVGDENGFNIDEVMDILVKGIEHANGTVRDASLECIMDIYKIKGDVVKKYFPPDDATSRKNPLYVKLFDGFDKADGKLTAAERKAAAAKEKEDLEKNKANEVKALQEQLEQLRGIAQQQVSAVAQQGSSAAGTKTPQENMREKQRKKSEARSIKERSVSFEPNSDGKVANIEKPVERLCIFCGEQNDAFSDENLDIHYWKSCPMLKRCDSCNEVVEISELDQHLISECANKVDFTTCKVCAVVITKSEEVEHLKGQQCAQNSKQKFVCRCPLCKTVVDAGDENWKAHLIENCQMNSERLQKANDIVKKPPAKKSGKVSSGQSKSVGRGGGKQTPRGQGKGKSKIPTISQSKK